MNIEILYPDLGMLFGDHGNCRYLAESLPEATIIETKGDSRPAFLDEEIDLVYMGCMSEASQLIAVNRLKPISSEFLSRIESGQRILMTGSSIELLGEYVEDNGRRTDCLGFFPFHTIRNMNRRLNFLFLGEFEGISIVGNKSQFSECVGEFEHPFIKVTGGMGNSIGAEVEGIHYKNLYATYVIGPILPLNPLLTEYFLKEMGSDLHAAYVDKAMSAYELRLAQLQNPEIEFDLREH